MKKAQRMAHKSVRLGNTLRNSGGVQAAQCYSEAALLRVHQVGGRQTLCGGQGHVRSSFKNFSSSVDSFGFRGIFFVLRQNSCESQR